MTALHLDRITVTFPDGDSRLTALDEVSLRVEAGQLVPLVGPSGSGKSTLLSVAATLLRPDSGRVLIGGTDAGGLSEKARAELRRKSVGIVFQQPNLLDSLTALEQLTVVAAMSGSLRGARGRTARGAALDLLAEVGLSDQRGRRPVQLSGGQRQRVNIARALMGSPSLLLVDEPTSALDHDRGAEIMALLRRLTVERNLATVLVTHDTAHLSGDDPVVECRDGHLRELVGPAPASR